MKYLSIIAILGLSLQAQASQIVEAEGIARDCCFRMTGDLDLTIRAAENAKINLLVECEKIYGHKAYINERSQRISQLNTSYVAGGADVFITATAVCRERVE